MGRLELILGFRGCRREMDMEAENTISIANISFIQMDPLHKSNDPLNYLESFPPVCDASNKSLNINFFQPFLLPINQSSIRLATSALDYTR